jgi:cytosine/adenosine deaminase-related metal-dependent hydrolase
VIFRAKYLIPNSRLIIENGAIAIHGSEIVDIGRYPTLRNTGTGPIRDLGDAVILPGLVNSHTHLELTNHGAFVDRTAQLTNWLLQIVRNQRWDKAWVDRAIQSGVEMSLAGGTTTVGDIHGSGQSAQTLKDAPIRKVVFLETTGFSPERSQIGTKRINTHLEAAPEPDSLIAFGVSPHAPYSTAASLYRHCCELALSRGLPLCTHLSETREEIEFLASGTNAFADLLTALQIPMEDWTPPNRTPVQYMKALGVLAVHPLLAHCNYLTDEDIQTLAESGASVVFCPRSHHYFYHTDHPLERLLAAGVNVAIGTDSLASNWSLAMLDELRFLGKAWDCLPPETLLDLVTINGARGLRLRHIGKLEKGWLADFIAIELRNSRQPIIEQILDESACNLLTVVGGKICYDAHAS